MERIQRLKICYLERQSRLQHGMSLKRNFLLKYILGSNSFNTNKKIYDECDTLLTKNKWSCFMLKRRESIQNGRDSLPVCDYSDCDILVFDFVHNMTGYNFVRFHFDGLLVSEDEREDVAEPKAFADLMLYLNQPKGFLRWNPASFCLDRMATQYKRVNNKSTQFKKNL